MQNEEGQIPIFGCQAHAKIPATASKRHAAGMKLSISLYFPDQIDCRARGTLWRAVNYKTAA